MESAMEGLGIFGDLPQLDPLPAVGSNHAQALQIRDDRLDIFGDLPQLDPLPAVGSNHAQALQTRDDRFDSFVHLPQCQFDPLPVVKTSTAAPAVVGNMLKRTHSRQISLMVCHHCRTSIAIRWTAGSHLASHKRQAQAAAGASGNTRPRGGWLTHRFLGADCRICAWMPWLTLWLLQNLMVTICWTSHLASPS